MKKIGLVICAVAMVIASFSFLTGCEQANADSGGMHLYVISAVDCRVLFHEVGAFYLPTDSGGVVGVMWGKERFYAGANMAFVTEADLNLKIGDVFTGFSPVVKEGK